MGIFDRFRSEKRSFSDGATVAQSDPRLIEIFGLNNLSYTGEAVTIESALRVPAFAAGVNFISGTIAGLPLQTFRKTPQGRKKVKSPLARALHKAPNPGMSSFEWRKMLFDSVLTGGRGFTYIERDERGRPVDFYILDPNCVTIKRENGVKTYEYKENGRNRVIYRADEIIDIPFMLKSDGLEHRGPVTMGRDALALSLALSKYGSKMFQNGGVPPFVVTGNFQTPEAMKRASNDLVASVRKAAKEERLALTLPAGMDIKNLGSDPEKMQMIETQRFCIEQIARILSLPPVFLQDLTHGTFSNTEQQDLHFVKHTLKRWIEQFEQELNLKLFGRDSNQYVELNVDGLLRGDFKTRVEGYARGIQAGIYKPSEPREWENLEYVEASDQLFMQGATVPIDMAGQQNQAPPGVNDDQE